MTKRNLMLSMLSMLSMLLMAGAHAFAENNQKRDPVEAFSSNIEYCAYMVSAPGWESREFSDRFESALRFAVRAMRQAHSKLSENQAIFALKAQCDITNSKPWPDQRR